MKIIQNKIKSSSKFITPVILCMITLGSCISDLLDTSPYDKVASGNMWTTDNLTDLGMAGVYNPLRYGFASDGGTTNRVLYQFDALSVTGQHRAAMSFLNGSITAGDGLFSNIWQDMYEGIFRANDAIYNIPPTSPSTPEKKARYVAEAKFMRAYYYFRLNQVYKGVPVYLEPVSLPDMTRSRETEAKVWEVIIQDLTDCINEPELPAKYETGNANFGHVTKGAAYALRGKVYLYTAQWDLAIADFTKVSELGYSLFQGGYKELFQEANEQCDEMIFSIQYLGVENFGSDSQFYCGTRSSFGSCWNTYLISPDLVDSYEYEDGGKFDWNDIIPGYNEMQPAKREVFFLRNNLTAAEITTETNKGLDMSLYMPDANEQRILQAYAARDPRLGANVITPYSSYIGALNNLPILQTSRFPYRTNNEPTQDLRTDTQVYFYYHHRKFVYEGLDTPNRAYCPTDFPIIRYADVLLMMAEAYAEKSSGISQEAIGFVNQVRARAGIAELNTSAETTVQDKADLINRIRNERRWEFPNEGINYFDEIRWGTWKEKVFYEGNGSKQVWGSVVNPYIWAGDYIYTWAIPRTELERNSNITQNTGWGN